MHNPPHDVKSRQTSSLQHAAQVHYYCSQSCALCTGAPYDDRRCSNISANRWHDCVFDDEYWPSSRRHMQVMSMTRAGQRQSFFPQDFFLRIPSSGKPLQLHDHCPSTPTPAVNSALYACRSAPPHECRSVLYDDTMQVADEHSRRNSSHSPSARHNLNTINSYSDRRADVLLIQSM